MPSLLQWWSALAPSPMEVVTSLIFIAIGAAIIPILAWLRLLRPKGFAARIMWTIGAFLTGRYGLIQRESGRYELAPVRKAGDGQLKAYLSDTTMQLKSYSDEWSRLGKQPFLISYEKTERAFRDVISDVGQAMADGGMEGVRGGYQSYIPDTEGGYNIRIYRLLERLRQAGGSRLGQIARRQGLREFGGDSNMSNFVMIGYVMTMAVLGLAAGIFLVT